MKDKGGGNQLQVIKDNWGLEADTGRPQSPSASSHLSPNLLTFNLTLSPLKEQHFFLLQPFRGGRGGGDLISSITASSPFYGKMEHFSPHFWTRLQYPQFSFTLFTLRSIYRRTDPGYTVLYQCVCVKKPNMDFFFGINVHNCSNFPKLIWFNIMSRCFLVFVFPSVYTKTQARFCCFSIKSPPGVPIY